MGKPARTQLRHRSVSVFKSLWGAALARRPEAALGAQVGAVVPFGAYEILDYVVTSEPSLSRAIGSLERYLRIMAPALGIEREDDERGHWVRLRWRDAQERSSPADDYSLALMVHRFRAHTEGGVDIECVELTRPPVEEASFRAAYDAPVRFGCGRAGILFPRSRLPAPMRRVDLTLNRVLRDAAERRLEDMPAVDSMSAQLTMHLREILSRGQPSITTAARTLNVSARTLQRRLADEGLTFSDVVDSTRRAQALTLLGARQHSIAEIAFLLGFADQSTFTRAFRRWTGRSPGRFQRTA